MTPSHTMYMTDKLRINLTVQDIIALNVWLLNIKQNNFVKNMMLESRPHGTVKFNLLSKIFLR
jgi:hypothetical protein